MTEKDHNEALLPADIPLAVNCGASITVEFSSLQQVLLFERLLRRLTRNDLQSLMFMNNDADVLLTTLGRVRVPIKSFLRKANEY